MPRGMNEVTSIQPQEARVPIPPLTGIAMILDWGAGAPDTCGQSSGAYSQADVVDSYSVRLAEELDAESVRLEIVNPRRGPAVPVGRRVEDAMAGHLALICSCDFYTRDRSTNSSIVEFSGDHLRPLAQRLNAAMSEWGKCSAFTHRGSLVAVNEPGHFIRIKPFALNGPSARDYLIRMDQLAVAVGRTIGEYFAEKNLQRRRR